MNEAANTTAESTIAAARRPSLAPRPRLAAAIASAVVTCTLLGGVVLGMASAAPQAEQIVAQAPQAART